MSTILLVEDDSDIAALTTIKLKRAGYTVVWRSDRVSAVEAASSVAPDLILMDVQLVPEEQGGLLATKTIKANPHTSGIPIIALSAYAAPPDRELAYAAGCSDVEEKPINEKRLIEKIKHHLSQRV